jgi:hypothetical protein
MSSPRNLAFVVLTLFQLLIVSACDVEKRSAVTDTDDQMMVLEEQLAAGGENTGLCMDYIALCEQGLGLCLEGRNAQTYEAFCGGLRSRCASTVETYCRAPVPDAGATPRDGGAPSRADAGTSVTDAGASRADAGARPSDGGPARPDSGIALDGGTRDAGTGDAGRVDTEAPTVPAGLKAIVNSSSKISLSWSASTDDVAVAGYTVFRNGLRSGTTSQTAYADTGLAAATKYIYAVTAFDEAGHDSPPSVSVSATTSSNVPVTDSTVQGFAAADGVTGGSGGANLVVTNLNYSGEGSLKAAIEKSGTRTITFSPGLSGTIHFSGVVYVPNDDVTIDGLGASIAISGYYQSVFKPK